MPDRTSSYYATVVSPWQYRTFCALSTYLQSYLAIFQPYAFASASLILAFVRINIHTRPLLLKYSPLNYRLFSSTSVSHSSQVYRSEHQFDDYLVFFQPFALWSSFAILQLSRYILLVYTLHFSRAVVIAVSPLWFSLFWLPFCSLFFSFSPPFLLPRHSRSHTLNVAIVVVFTASLSSFSLHRYCRHFYCIVIVVIFTALFSIFDLDFSRFSAHRYIVAWSCCFCSSASLFISWDRPRIIWALL